MSDSEYNDFLEDVHAALGIADGLRDFGRKADSLVISRLVGLVLKKTRRHAPRPHRPEESA